MAARCLALAALVSTADAHRPILARTTEGSEYHTMATALEIPWIAKSWAVNRVATCDAPVFWMTADVPTDGFPLYVGAGIPRLARFANTRIAALLIGPGVGTADTPPASGVPSEVALAIPSGKGAVLFTAAVDQSTCNYVDAPTPFSQSPDVTVVLGRCNFYESWGNSDSWPQIDEVTTVGHGTYTVAFWAYDGSDSSTISTGKFWATMSADDMAEDFNPIKAHSCETTVVAACADADLTSTPQTTCEGAGACTYRPEVAAGGQYPPVPHKCETTVVAACGSADLSPPNAQTNCEAAGACTYSPGPATAWGPEVYLGGGGMGPDGVFTVPSNQPDSFYEHGAHVGMANMAPAAVACEVCQYGTGHSGTDDSYLNGRDTSCPAGCDTSSGCATIACSAANANEATCVQAGTDAAVVGAACAFSAGGPAPYGPPTPDTCSPTQDDCNLHRDYGANEVTCTGVDGAVAGENSELTTTPCTEEEVTAAAVKLCPLVAQSLAQCDTLVSSAKANPTVASNVNMQSRCGSNTDWAAPIPTATLGEYCTVECPAEHFCAAYAASDCADEFEGCMTAVASMPAGDDDATNDATEAGAQSCVVKHLSLVDQADSAHCAHARGEGPCNDAAGNTPPVKASATVCVAMSALVGLACATALAL